MSRTPRSSAEIHLPGRRGFDVNVPLAPDGAVHMRSLAGQGQQWRQSVGGNGGVSPGPLPLRLLSYPRLNPFASAIGLISRSLFSRCGSAYANRSERRKRLRKKIYARHQGRKGHLAISSQQPDAANDDEVETKEDKNRGRQKQRSRGRWHCAGMNELKKWNELYGEDGSRKKQSPTYCLQHPYIASSNLKS
eukprot:Gb_00193 [translate_table: standard]